MTLFFKILSLLTQLHRMEVITMKKMTENVQRKTNGGSLWWGYRCRECQQWFWTQAAMGWHLLLRGHKKGAYVAFT